MTDNWQDVAARLRDLSGDIDDDVRSRNPTIMKPWVSTAASQSCTTAAALIEKQAAEIQRLREQMGQAAKFMDGKGWHLAASVTSMRALSASKGDDI